MVLHLTVPVWSHERAYNHDFFHVPSNAHDHSDDLVIVVIIMMVIAPLLSGEPGLSGVGCPHWGCLRS